MNLSERLEQMANAHAQAHDPDAVVLYEAARQLVTLASTNAELTKRVAELEKLTADCHDVMVACKRRESELRDQIADLQEMERLAFLVVDAEQETQVAKARIVELQSQLAWTPVEKGLPTGDGEYEVLWNGNEITGPFSSDALASFPESMRALWTHFRRIELPEAK